MEIKGKLNINEICYIQILFFLFDLYISFIEGSHTKAFFEEFLQGNAISFDFKWLRGVHKGSFTGMQILSKTIEKYLVRDITQWAFNPHKMLL